MQTPRLIFPRVNKQLNLVLNKILSVLNILFIAVKLKERKYQKYDVNKEEETNSVIELNIKKRVINIFNFQLLSHECAEKLFIDNIPT